MRKGRPLVITGMALFFSGGKLMSNSGVLLIIERM
ncbi:hypothetical protein SAMN05216352_108207 [Alteribacillus bidgolensis]|uniref:Uncharacterized protein n=1 Tax=Alteribacillus bidgolensis TaxID=930129 RepID=A0A1G8LAK5_9BACI|nr:hypothetical protein SAMN05216352_108207 [Alteribacillus bidgolensis]